MIGSPGFESWTDMQNSDWLKKVSEQMNNGEWPLECQRCQKTEHTNSSHSIRLDSIKRDKILSKIDKDYLILGGVLDNICNSACQSCNSGLSTKIGSLESKNYTKISNVALFEKIPTNRIVEIDLNGGEPTASPEYQNLLYNLPENVKVLRTNTNGSRLLPNIKNILDREVQLIVTLSLDGIGNTHDYVRWPIKWQKYTAVVNEYLSLREQYRNLKLEAWTTVHSLNVCDFDRIVQFTERHKIDHSWAFLVNPAPLDPVYSNSFTEHAKKSISNKDITDYIATGSNNQSQLDTFVAHQDKLRDIKIEDYL